MLKPAPSWASPLIKTKHFNIQTNNICNKANRTTSDTNIGKLQKIQNRGMRIILQCLLRTHIADMLSNLKWLSIKQRIMFLTVVLVFIMSYEFQNSQLHVSLIGPCFTSVRYKEIHLWGDFRTQITPKFAHYQRLWN